MKTKKNLLILLLIAFFAAIIIIVFYIIYSKDSDIYLKELDKSDKKLVVEKGYTNNAWGFYSNGTAIYNDGTIYKWNYSGKYAEIDSKFIIEQGKKQKNKVKKEDIQKIEYLIEHINKKTKLTYSCCDLGTTYYKVYSKNNKEIIISESGDSNGENTSSSAKRLKKIISKYIK